MDLKRGSNRQQRFFKAEFFTDGEVRFGETREEEVIAVEQVTTRAWIKILTLVVGKERMEFGDVV